MRFNTQLPIPMWQLEYLGANKGKAHIVAPDGSRVTPPQHPISITAGARICEVRNRETAELLAQKPEQTAMAVKEMLLALMPKLRLL